MNLTKSINKMKLWNNLKREKRTSYKQKLVLVFYYSLKIDRNNNKQTNKHKNSMMIDHALEKEKRNEKLARDDWYDIISSYHIRKKRERENIYSCEFTGKRKNEKKKFLFDYKNMISGKSSFGRNEKKKNRFDSNN